MNQGAIQLEVIINNKNISIKKENLVSLKVSRVIGDAANSFTLEVFDDTAWQLENAIMGTSLAPITIRYSASNSLNNSIMFTGTCLDYQLSFAGRATLLSITGVLSATSDTTEVGWCFEKRAIKWVGDMVKDSDGNIILDGKTEAQFSNYKYNEDICAYITETTDDNGNSIQRVFYNPSRIFKRIIHAYNGDKLGSTEEKTVTQTEYNIKKADTLVGPTLSSGTTGSSGDKLFIFVFLVSNGFTEQAAAGVMGNIQQESGFRTNNVQDGMGYSDSDYTNAITSGKMSKSEFSNDGRGYGLCQWTYHSRKAALYDYCGASQIANATKQLEFMIKEMKSYFGSSYNDFIKSTSVDWAAREFHKVYESSADDEVGIQKRINYANNIYQDSKTNFSTITTTVTTTTTVFDSTTTISGWGKGGTNNFKIGSVDDSRWIEGLNVVQSANQTTAQYITDVLCKAAISDSGANYEDEIAGFKYYVDANGHNFKALDYDKSKTTKLVIQYGMQNSNVISFSVADIGTLAMCGASDDSKKIAQKNLLLNSSSIDYLYGNILTQSGSNVLGNDTADDDSNILYSNIKLQGVYVSSSSTPTLLDTTRKKAFDDLQKMVFPAELTLWAGTDTKSYAPGDFLDITVIGNGGIRHYSSGVYLILHIDDNISADGFTQTMKLLKNPNAISSSTDLNTSAVNSTKENTITSYTSTGKSSSGGGTGSFGSSTSNSGGGFR